MPTIDERVTSIEKNIWIATGAIGVFALWLGYTSFIAIPNAVASAPVIQAAQEALKKIDDLRQSAQKSSDQIAQIEKSGATIQIGGVCFRPRTIFRCYGSPDHLTWFENAQECKNAGYNIEYQTAVLAQCP